jgi:hypothetical protein
MDFEPLQVPGLKRPKQMPKHAYEEWKSSVFSSNETSKAIGLEKKRKQMQLSFEKKPSHTVPLEGS